MHADTDVEERKWLTCGGISQSWYWRVSGVVSGNLEVKLAAVRKVSLITVCYKITSAMNYAPERV